MFTLLEKIANLLLNFTKSYLEHRDHQRKKEFGESILTCYLRLLEVISTGKVIITRLEDYVDYHPENLLRYSKEDWEFKTLYWKKLFLKQSINLDRLADAMFEIRNELCVLAPEVAELLPVTAVRKRIKVRELLGLTSMLADGEFPVQTLSKIGENEKIDFSSISSEKTRKDIERYLIIDAPKHNLDELEKLAGQIRELIIQHLKIEEILWSINRFDS